MLGKLKEWYFRYCVALPVIGVLMATALVAGLSFYSDRFRLDASADSLVLENDKALQFYRSIRARYDSDDFLIVAYSPDADVFSDSTLSSLKAMQTELEAIERVSSVKSILNVPLLDSPRVSLSELRKKIRTLQDSDTDRNLAEKEFLSSPLYKDLLLSSDSKTTALQINFKRDEQYLSLLQARNQLREKRLTGILDSEYHAKLEQAERAFKTYAESVMDQERQDIRSIRTILNKYRSNAEIFLGGIPMIVADMIEFIQHDIQVFGIGIVIFIIILLSFSFKKPRWVIIPMVICFLTGLGMIGYLGLLEWRVTVVSSNFISLLLIITLSLVVHLVVRYQELHTTNPQAENAELIRNTIKSKVVPSVYTAITTMVAFGSLVVSGIRPVIDFGWMMVLGVGLAFILAFLLFPSLLAFLHAGAPVTRKIDITSKVTNWFAYIVEKYTNTTLLFYIAIIIISITGISLLTVENRFIDYFKSDTEIYQGMLKIDQKLGGTTPLDVILDPDQEFIEFNREFSDSSSPQHEDDINIKNSAGISGNSYWFNIFQLETVARVHEYLESRPELGKTLSMSTTMELLTLINNDQEIDNFSLAIMYKRLPDDIKSTLFNPYMAQDGNQMRFAVRIYDSNKDLNRAKLLSDINSDLMEKFDFEPDQVHLSGMAVLYNNLLQSLYTSQILTIGFVFLVILVMFIVLFRSLPVAILAIIPNIVAAGLILGLMGWLQIPLDIMTITIAAITIGIAVDDTIHFIHRFKEEFQKDCDYWATIKRCHNSIGRAMYYTSITITLGFSILVLSNFIPTIYFGLLTGLAMIVAMVANLTLLPVLLVKFKPLKENTK